MDDLVKTVDRMFGRTVGHGDMEGIGRTVQIKYIAETYAAIPHLYVF